ncbi:MAG TPA: universal stress protein [Solirubrobacteraceae bacterium]|nr:universal stress protein [Solirubrobacteraceae bacterium]
MSDRCLVVGYDRGESARTAVEWAARQLPADGRLVVVFAEKPLHAPQSPLSSAGERRRFAGAAIDELLLEADGAVLDCEIVTEISEQDPVSALREAARRHGAEAIVLGSQQHSRVHQAIGTVTSSLLKDSPVPVTVVPSPAIDPLPSDSY